MKHSLLILALFLGYFSNAQSSIRPNAGLHIWNTSAWRGDIQFETFAATGVSYEQVFGDRFGMRLGASHNLALVDQENSFLNFSLGARYGLKDLHKGGFVDLSSGYGLSLGSRFYNLTAGFGYSFPVGKGTLSPSIGLGYQIKRWYDNFWLSGFQMPINLTYAIIIE